MDRPDGFDGGTGGTGSLDLLPTILGGVLGLLAVAALVVIAIFLIRISRDVATIRADAAAVRAGTVGGVAPRHMPRMHAASPFDAPTPPAPAASVGDTSAPAAGSPESSEGRLPS
ncbi:hypothetical protein RN607_09160 [Demequina capsici]|uniref:Uncharacterized protein n=1 Tax=Demequina capsici TaxID=3075620 RepID=A0AA96JF49_9MICO|nr:hypothetical protein [Demequina sp. PMTSA13]WNM26369.1 hypothetical protein RN607_09160 [Demequina sp. PMTSA13]